MAATLIADVIVPELFTSYVLENTVLTNRFFQSGIMQTVADDFGDLAQMGQAVNMPFWQDLAGEDQLLDDQTDLTVGAINASQDIAVLHARALVYGAKDLAGDLAGDDPAGSLQQRYVTKWNERINSLAINTIKGSMGALKAESPDVNVLDISALSGAAAVIDGAAFLDAQQLLGDMKDQLTGVGMHSAVENKLAKLDLITYAKDSDGNPTIPFYMGKRVIVDDALTPTGGVYDTVLFGPGALGFVEGTPKVPVETERNGLKGGGEEYLISRRHMVVHPRGIKWDAASGVPAKTTPSNAEVAAAGNWSRVYEAKNIRMVLFQHRIATA